jgi:thiol-disulfide isomerase/thioredoxin
MTAMKKISMILLLSWAAVGAKAQQTVFLDEGTKLTDYPKVEWLKGEPVTHFDKTKIYIVELWATWCVPCIAAMPHLNDLNKKFKDKNVVFIAQDIKEDSKEKVEAFVKQKGDNMSYAVAFSGPSGSDFDKKWVQAAGVNAIPQTFVIQNNTLLWQITPYMLNEEVLQLLVDGKFSIEAAEAIAKKKH